MTVWLRNSVVGIVMGGAIAALAAPAIAQNAVPEALLGSTPQTVIWGYITADLPAALTIKSGETVRIDTVSHQSLLGKDDPVTFFGTAGIPPSEVLQDASDIYRMVGRVKGLSAHVLTGPLYVDDAAPGDLLEVRIRNSRSSSLSPRRLRQWLRSERSCGNLCWKNSSVKYWKYGS
jgi:hypothetical protein